MAAARYSTALLLTCSLAALAGPDAARADWIVTRQGQRIETSGAWQEKGKLVIFHLADGKLSSLRLSDVDLEASRTATRQAKEAPVAAPVQQPVKPRKPSVAKLTDKDFQHPAAAPAERAEDKSAGAPDKKPPGVAVANWERGKAEDDGHVLITGTVRNPTSAQATSVTVAIRLFDETGKQIAQGEAVMTSSVIPAGGSAGFRADFAGVFSFAAAKLDARSFNLTTKPSSPSGIPAKEG
jgi:hypothetical protein